MKNKRIKIALSVFVIAVVAVSAWALLVRFFPEISSGVAALTGQKDKKPTLEIADAASVGVKTYTFEELENADNVKFDSSLMLVNKEFKLSNDFVPELTDINNSGVNLDKNFAAAYLELKKAVKDNCDDNLYIMSSFRTAEEQKKIKREEGDTAAEVGASEHQTGLAADVYVMYYAGAGFIDSEAGKFVNKNCKDYGFIIRYPDYGVNSTGIGYEPWHLRFVGLPHADIIMSQKLTLEQYVEGLKKDILYVYGEYIITRTDGKDGFTLPLSFVSCTVSPDNTGMYICTVKTK